MKTKEAADAIADAIDRAIAETPINWRKIAINFVLSPIVAMWSAVAICVMCGQWTVSIIPAALTACSFMSLGFVAGAAFVISERER